MAGRAHDYPEQFAAGLKTHAVSEKYYYARRPEITRVVDITNFVEKKVDANLANQAKGPGGHHGSRLRAELAEVRAEAKEAVERTHRQYRRDLVPVRASAVVYRERGR